MAEERSGLQARLSWKAELKSKKSDIDEIQQIEHRIQIAQKAIAFDPKDVLGYFSLGSVYVDAKRYIEAVDVLGEAIAVDPKHSPSYAILGQALEACGQKEQAKKIYEQGIGVAKEKGDIVPLKRMESRLKKLMGLL